MRQRRTIGLGRHLFLTLRGLPAEVSSRIQRLSRLRTSIAVGM